MAPYAGPVIDAHHHLWTLRPGSHPWLGTQPFAREFSATDYNMTFADQQIAATVWVEALASNPASELAEADRIRKTSQGRIGAALIAHVPLDAPDVAQRLEACAALSPAFRGVRDILAPHVARAADLLDRPGFVDGLRALADRGLVFDAMLTPAQMLQAERLCARVPGLSVAIEHVGSPHDRSDAGLALWMEGLDAFAALPNTIVKVSALHCLVRDWSDESLAAILAPIRSRFGAGRMCVGTDWPVHDETCPGPEALDAFRRITADWPPDEQHALFYGTAARVYGIEPLTGRGAAPSPSPDQKSQTRSPC